MKKILSAAVLAAFLGAPAYAATTVSVDDGSDVRVNRGGNVTVNSGQPQPAVVERVVVAEPQNGEYDIEGYIVNVNQPESEIVVRDVKPHDRRLVGDRGIVSTLKVGDYVVVNLRPGSQREAKRIIERPAPEGTTYTTTAAPARTYTTTTSSY